MLCDALIRHCSPTLAGIKTGNLFSLRTEGRDITPEIRAMNRVLVKKGLRLLPLRKSEKTTLIYLFRPDMLEKDLAYPEAASILKEKGYPCGNSNFCVVALIRHLLSDATFPHEIGLFLGYPPSDVRCFMRDTRKGVRCVGCWKAYGDPCEAEKTFARFKQCTAIYRRESENGIPLERLIVDSRGQGRCRAAYS